MQVTLQAAQYFNLLETKTYNVLIYHSNWEGYVVA